MKINNKLVCALTLVTAAFFLNGCSSGDDNGDNSTDDGNTTPVTINSTIKLTDTPIGYASLGTSYVTSGTQTTVTTKAELVSALSNGGVIIVDGMIDMSYDSTYGGPLMPTTAGGTNDYLDAFVKAKTSSAYSTYTAFKTAYAQSCSSTTNDKESSSPESSLGSTLWSLNSAYGNIIKLTIKSNTTLIGKSAGCGIKGGTVSLSNVSNVIIRNLTIQDAYDPFPHHESGDGFNAQQDCITIQNTCKNIWIDHCTLQDTLGVSKVTTSSGSEKWQTYDGLCDIKNLSTNITVSNCKFYNHDKTMLIGSSDEDGDNSVRFITLYANYFYNCGQRLPMVRNTTIHILNNYYDASNPTYTQSYAVGCRLDCIVYAENNWFGSGIKYSFKDSKGFLYSSGNTDKSSSGCNSTVTGSTLFSSAVNKYSYTPMSASAAKTYVKANAGAGCTLGE